MEVCRGSVAIGPSAPDSTSHRHIAVVGQVLAPEVAPLESGVWLFTALPLRADSMISTFRLRGADVDPADLVRVGTLLALYTEPQFGDLGGVLLDRLGGIDDTAAQVTPEIAELARPITTWELTAVLTGGPDLEPIAAGLADGRWSVQVARLGAVLPASAPVSDSETPVLHVGTAR